MKTDQYVTIDAYAGRVCVTGPKERWSEVMSTFWQEVDRLLGAPPPAIANWASQRPIEYQVMRVTSRSPEAALGWDAVAKSIARQPAGGATLMVAQLDDRDAAVWQVLRRRGRSWRGEWPDLAGSHIAVHQQIVLVVWGGGQVAAVMPSFAAGVFRFEDDRLLGANFGLHCWLRALYPRHAAESDKLQEQHGLPEPPSGGLWRTVIDCSLFVVAAEIRACYRWPFWPLIRTKRWWLVSSRLDSPESLGTSSLYAWRPVLTMRMAISRKLDVPWSTVEELIKRERE